MITSATARQHCSPPSTCSRAGSSASAWRAIGIRNSSASSIRSPRDPDCCGAAPDRRQLCDAQAPQGPRLARTAQALPFPLHPDIGLMAQCRRGPLRQTDPAAAKYGVFKGIVDLQAAINRFLAETNQNPKPFTWTADPDAIIDKVRRGKQVLESIH